MKAFGLSALINLVNIRKLPTPKASKIKTPNMYSLAFLELLSKFNLDLSLILKLLMLSLALESIFLFIILFPHVISLFGLLFVLLL